MSEVVARDARYVINATKIAAIPALLLEKSVANLEAEHYHIVRVIDLVFTGV